jgi:hypothetical protein
MRKTHYDVLIVTCIISLPVLGFIAPSYPPLKDWFLLAISSVLSLALFFVALRIDKDSSLLLLAILSKERRKIIEYLAEDHTYKELEAAFPDSKTLDEDLEYLMYVGVIKEKKNADPKEKVYRREL